MHRNRSHRLVSVIVVDVVIRVRDEDGVLGGDDGEVGVFLRDESCRRGVRNAVVVHGEELCSRLVLGWEGREGRGPHAAGRENDAQRKGRRAEIGSKCKIR